MQEILLKNISIDNEKYELNEFAYLKKIEDKTYLIINTGGMWETNLPLWIRSLQLAFPKVNLRMKSEDIGNQDIINAYTNSIINYYFKNEGDLDVDDKRIDINQDGINHLIKVNCLIIDHNKENKEMRENGTWKPNRWIYTYNQYLNACNSLSIEISILNLITALESLLVRGSGEISYRVRLFSSLVYSDTYEDRKEVADLVRGMYDLRSKVAHGEINEVIKRLSNPNIYNNYFKLKEICADILIKLYDFDELVIFNRLEELLLTCPKFTNK